MTLEYGMFKCEHPTLDFVTPLVFRLVYKGVEFQNKLLYSVTSKRFSSLEYYYFQTDSLFRQRYKERTLPIFDIIISYSSLEHSGLGKYSQNRQINIYFQWPCLFARELNSSIIKLLSLIKTVSINVKHSRSWPQA